VVAPRHSLGKIRHWKSLPSNDWWWHSRLKRLSACCRQL
jgi:hypothetical protein